MGSFLYPAKNTISTPETLFLPTTVQMTFSFESLQTPSHHVNTTKPAIARLRYDSFSALSTPYLRATSSTQRPELLSRCCAQSIA